MESLQAAGAKEYDIWRLALDASDDVSQSSTDDLYAPGREDIPGGAPHRARQRNGRVPVENGGVAAAVTLALAILLFASRPGGAPTPLPSGILKDAPATGEQTSNLQRSTQAPPVTNPGLATVQGLSPQERAAAAADAAAASASLMHWTDGDPPASSQRPSGADPSASAVSQDTAPPPSSVTPTKPPVSDAEHQSPLPNAGGPPAIASTIPPASVPVVATTAPHLIAARPANLGPVAASPTTSVFAAPPKWISGGPTGTDNRHGRYRGAVVVQFTVGVDGRASNCIPVRTSGNSELDALTCRLLVERGQFAPARDAQGRMVAREVYATYVWGRGRHSKR